MAIRSDAIFRQAERFRYAGQKLHHGVSSSDGSLSAIIFPFMVCDSFAAELYLKCINHLEGGIYPSTHDLKKLFSRLSFAWQQLVEEKFNEVLSSLPLEFVSEMKSAGDKIDDIRYCIGKSKDAFERMRYVYEEKNNGSVLITHVTCGIRLAILSKIPAWREFALGPDY
jgi:HEPN domain-containing protein